MMGVFVFCGGLELLWMSQVLRELDVAVCQGGVTGDGTEGRKTEEEEGEIWTI